MAYRKCISHWSCANALYSG